MKLNGTRVLLVFDAALQRRSDIFTPAPLEAAAPGTIIFVPTPKYLDALRLLLQPWAASGPQSCAHDAPLRGGCYENPYPTRPSCWRFFFSAVPAAAGIDATARIALGASGGAPSVSGLLCVVSADFEGRPRLRAPSFTSRAIPGRAARQTLVWGVHSLRGSSFARRDEPETA